MGEREEPRHARLWSALACAQSSDIEAFGHKWPMRQPYGPLEAVGYDAQYEEVDYYFEEIFQFLADHPMP